MSDSVRLDQTEMFRAMRPPDIIDAAECVRLFSLFAVAVNARNVHAVTDAMRALRAAGVGVCLTARRGQAVPR